MFTIELLGLYLRLRLTLVTHSVTQSPSAICGPGRTTRVRLLLMLLSKCLLHDNVLPSPQQTFYFSHTDKDMD